MSDQAVDPPKRSRWKKSAALLIGVLLLGAALGWSAARLLRAPAAGSAAPQIQVITAQSGTISRVVQLTATAQWPQSHVYPLGLDGVITRVDLSGVRKLTQGTKVCEVNLQPVFVLQGTTPAFRALTSGVVGPDVSQLQDFLQTAGYRSAKSNGTFDADTAAQVKAWQRASGQSVTGSVARGVLVFVPKLPVKGFVTAEVAVGAAAGAAGGLATLSGEPTFKIPATALQAALLAPDQQADLSYDKYRWKAKIGTIGAPANDGTVPVTLVPASGTSMCGAQCEAVPAAGLSGLSVRVAVVPPTTGVLIPTTALGRAASGAVSVRLESGAETPVTVLASADGQAVVSGISSGQRLRVSS